MHAALRKAPRPLVAGIVIVAALLALVAATSTRSTGDPLNRGGLGVRVNAAGENVTAGQQLVNLDGHTRLVFTGTRCRDSAYGSGVVAVRTCNTQDDLGSLGGNWKGTRTWSWNPPAPLGHNGDVLQYPAKYGYIQTCTAPGGDCVGYDDGQTAAWELDDTLSSANTIWVHLEGHYGSVDYCRRIFFNEAGQHSEEVLNAGGSLCVHD